MPEIELVGLGRMGLPICAYLVRAGYRVLAGDRRPDPTGAGMDQGDLGRGASHGVRAPGQVRAI